MASNERNMAKAINNNNNNSPISLLELAAGEMFETSNTYAEKSEDATADSHCIRASNAGEKIEFDDDACKIIHVIWHIESDCEFDVRTKGDTAEKTGFEVDRKHKAKTTIHILNKLRLKLLKSTDAIGNKLI